jgi:hypothetical protein
MSTKKKRIVVDRNHNIIEGGHRTAITKLMQRRHFELIAQVINLIGEDVVDRDTVACMFADALLREKVNKNFSSQRFIEACVK